MSIRIRPGVLAVATALVAVAAGAAIVAAEQGSTPHRTATGIGAAHPTTHLVGRPAAPVSSGAPTVSAAPAQQADARTVRVDQHTYRTASGGVVVALSAADHASSRAGSVPWIAYIHGGGWVAGRPTQSNALAFCRNQVQRGFACFSLGYDLAPKAVWPRQQTQVDDEIAWIRRHAATFSLDQRAGFVIGHSAGGLMSMIAGLHDHELAGMVSLDGATDVPYTIVHNAERHVAHDASVLVGGAAPDSALARSASVTGNLHGDFARTPALVIHESGDPVVDEAQSTILVRGLQAAHVPVTYDVFPGASHASEQDPEPVAALEAWLAGRLADLDAVGTAR